MDRKGERVRKSPVLYLLPPAVLPALRVGSRQMPERARLTADGVDRVQTRLGTLAIHRATGAWAYLSPAETELLAALDGRTVEELSPPPGWDEDEVAFFVEHLWNRGIVSADGHRVVAATAVATDVAAAQQTYFLSLQLSRGCNLACTYCYWGHATPTEERAMAPGVAKEAIERALEEPGDRLAVDFGEIAVTEALFRSLVPYARTAAAKAGKTLDLSIQTNGTTLDDALVAFLREERIFVNISLDGPAELNDRARVSHGGGGAHARTAAGIRRVVAAGLPHQVKVTVARHNVESPEQVIDHLLELRVEDFMLKPVLARGAARDAWSHLGVHAAEYTTFRRRAIEHALRRAPGFFDQMLRNFLQRSLGAADGWIFACTSRSCLAGRQMVVVEPDGRLAACPRFIGLPPALESLSDPGRHRSLRLALAPVLREPPPECTTCPWLRLCGAGCTLAGQESLCDPAPRLDVQCDIHKGDFELLFGEVIPHLVEHEEPARHLGTLQVLRWAAAGASDQGRSPG